MASKRTKLMIDMCKENGFDNLCAVEDGKQTWQEICCTSTNVIDQIPSTSQDVLTEMSEQSNKKEFVTLHNVPLSTTPYFEDDVSSIHEVLPSPGNEQLGDDPGDCDDSDKDKDYAPESESSDSDMVNLQQLADKIKKKNNNSAGQVENVIKENRRGRKTVKEETREKRKLRKTNRNLGREYTTSKGKLIRKRERRPLCSCRNGCCSKVDDVQLDMLFDYFWSIGDFDERVAYTASLITKQRKKTAITSERKKKRDCVNVFHLKVNGELIQVCKGCFEKTFDISNKFITTVLLKMNSTGICEKDKRGRKEPPNKISENSLQLVKDHIASIPTYESHYCRRNSEKRFLPSFYTLIRLYEEYKIWVPPNNKPVSRKIYEHVFHEMGIKIKKFQKDTCATCEKLNILIRNEKNSETLSRLKTELQSHLDEAQAAFDSKRQDKGLAKQDETKLVYVFDLQQCLPTPDLTASVAFYKRKLWTYNLTMHECKKKQAICCMWYETISGRGANQVASCVFRELLSLPPEIKHVTLYSDTCGGQNKNSHIVAMFLVLMQLTHLESVDHKFLVPGHTHMECDSDHSVIERKKKKYEYPINHPRDWFQLVRLCRQANNKFQVIEMNREHFYSFSDLLKKVFQVKKKDEEGNHFVWKNVKWLRFEKKKWTFYYKTSLSYIAPFHEMDFSRRGQTKEIPVSAIPKCQFPNPITEEKKKNLIDLLPYIDNVFHEFYKGLPTQKDLHEILPDIEEIDEDNIE
ncbi:uncharacterized protein LOC126742537 [Anthonomus grandis grandis]|uniref:uncharacterized protein LOC126742537 n=1 Tax=Anthonomus grandis grandis TaxID=2921223 RepID=UPI002166AB7B|nr:uncharacterized protein LOC126742537 [Anthonomus grandis grandis]